MPCISRTTAQHGWFANSDDGGIVRFWRADEIRTQLFCWGQVSVWTVLLFLCLLLLLDSCLWVGRRPLMAGCFVLPWKMAVMASYQQTMYKRYPKMNKILRLFILKIVWEKVARGFNHFWIQVQEALIPQQKAPSGHRDVLMLPSNWSTHKKLAACIQKRCRGLLCWARIRKGCSLLRTTLEDG